MGMFTSMHHPLDGRELQIKTGDDQCDYYCIGNKVERYIDRECFKSGCLFDGVYPSISDLGDDAWVVIKDGTFYSVWPRSFSREDILVIEQIVSGYRWQWYDIRAIAIYYTRQIYRDIRYWFENRKFEKSIAHLPFGDQQAVRLVRPLLRTMEYSSLVRKAFTVKEIKEVNKKFFFWR